MARLADRIRAFLNPPTPKPTERLNKNGLDDMALASRSVIRASYDSVMRTPENARHWQWSDQLSADSSLDPSVRIALRSQSRYELNENNSYGRGMVETLVTDTIGCGPRLQVTQFSHNINQQVEEAWHQWAAAIDLADDLETIKNSKIVDGESVIRFINNIGLDFPVALDLQLIECDQLRSPAFEAEVTETYVDGVHLDRFGNPFGYDILRHHPGARYWRAIDHYAYDFYPLSQIIHFFHGIRPGQHRGVSEFAPALPLFAFLRRFTLATVSAAETAASVSQVVETDAPIPEELEEEYSAATFDKWMDSIPVDRNSATVLPNMWKLKQFAAEHPTTTYAMFKRELIQEIGRCLCVPTNIAAGDSGQSNFSSAQFDWLGYERKIVKEQQRLNRQVMDRIFAEWLIEASLVELLPRRVSNVVLASLDAYGRTSVARSIQHAWHWEGLKEANARDAANAQRTKLQNGTTHRAKEYAREGLDIEIEDRKAAESFGVDVETYRQWVLASIFTNGNMLQVQEANDPGSTQQGQSNGNEEEEEGEASTEDSESESSASEQPA